MDTTRDGAVSAPEVAAPTLLPGPVEVVEQAWRDWNAGEGRERRTASYLWTIAHLGRFAGGVASTVLLGCLATAIGLPSPFWPLAVAVLNLGAWVAFDVSCYRRHQERAKANGLAEASPAPMWKLATTLFFTIAGIWVAAAAVIGSGAAILWLLVLTAAAKVIAYLWLRRMLTVQQAGVPYLGRLLDFPQPVADAGRLKAFWEPGTPGGRHLVIGGALGSRLAVGIATELGLGLGIGRYGTLASLLRAGTEAPGAGEPLAIARFPWLVKALLTVQKLAYKDESLREARTVREWGREGGRALWPWQEAELIVIDGLGDLAMIASDPVQAAEAALTGRLDPRLRQQLKHRRTIWVVGESATPASWSAMLERVLDIPSGNIVTLALTAEQAAPAAA